MEILSSHGNHDFEEVNFQKVSNQVDEAIANLQLLKKSVPDLVLDETLLGKLENIKISVASMQDLSVHRLALKEIIAEIGDAVKVWENDSTKPRFNVDAENLKGGNKHARLIELATLFEERPMPGVVVPYPRAVLNEQMHAFLDKAAHDVKEKWNSLKDLYEKHLEAKKPVFDFLKQPEVQDILKDINQALAEAFSNEELDMPSEFWQWIRGHKENNSYLMVRSSGSEDSRTAANAGGNESIAYVDPEPKAVMQALGKVVQSYFSEGSLQNRLHSNENPFTSLLKLDVTTQELIGESPGGSKDPSKIPVSLVMFTNEPNYTGNEKFRVMRISATYGHGEGVVGAAGVKSDTILILRSVKHPDRLYILENNQVKPTRLAPGTDLKLKKEPNSETDANRPALDHTMLTRLFYAGIAVEKAYGGHPMDMELVVRDGIIYPVQARTVNRPAANPTYFDQRKADPSALLEQFQAEAFLSGRAKTKILTSPDEILIIDDLAKAEKMVRPGIHKLIIIKQEEPANSHPVVNMSEMGIPVMYHEKTPEVSSIINKVGNGKVLVACVQSGNLALLDSTKMDPKDCISTGYTVHPAKIALSVASKPLPKTSVKASETPQEIKNALMKIRAVETEQEGLAALKTLKNQIVQTRESLTEKMTTERAKDLESGLSKLENAFTRSISEAKALQKQTGDKRLHGLFHAKVIEKLVTQPENSRALGQLSIINANAQMEEVEKIFAYQNKFDFPTVFHDEILATSACMTKEQEGEWETFLIKIENDLHDGRITMEQAAAFKDLLKTTKDLDLLPLWMIRFFLPQGSSQSIQQLLESFTPETKALVQEMHAIAEEIKDLEDNLHLFSDPATYDKAFDELMKLHAKFTGDLKNQLELAGPFGRIAAYQVMGQYVDLHDGAIKSMKASQDVPRERKVELMTEMLKPYYELLEGWTQNLSGSLLQYHEDWPLDIYMEQLKLQMAKTGNGVNELHPSGSFKVNSAILGSVTAFERALPSTKEDIFTLIHQNLLSSLNVLLASEMKGRTLLPPALERASNAAEGIASLPMGKHFNENERMPKLPIQLVGYSFPPGQIVLHYNYPLRNHSATFSLTFDKETQECQISLKFLGQARARYPIMGGVMQFLNSVGHISLVGPIEMNDMELSYTVKLTDEKSITNALVEIQKQAALTLIANYEYFYSGLCNWMEEEYGEEMVLAHLSKLDVPELSRLGTFYLYEKILEETNPDKAWDLCLRILNLENPESIYKEDMSFNKILVMASAVLQEKNPENLEEQLKEIARSPSSRKLNLRILLKTKPPVIPQETVANILFDPVVIQQFQQGEKAENKWTLPMWKYAVTLLLKEKGGLEQARLLYENPDTSPEVKDVLKGFL